MRILDPAVLAPWIGRMINIHPSLLPKYRGLRTHERAIEAGDTVHGASVHFVTAELDGGPVIAQIEIPLEAGDTPRDARRAAAAARAPAAGRLRRASSLPDASHCAVTASSSTAARLPRR